MKILSIDPWGNKQDGYDWDNWYHVGDISKVEFESIQSDKDFATWFYNNGYTTTNDMRRLIIDDDQNNIVICEKRSGMPLFAIEYGPEYY